MKLYFAGNITPVREREYRYLLSNRLFSYYYHGEQKEFEAEFIFKINTMTKENK